MEEIRKGRKTVYDTWLHRDPELNIYEKPTGKPR